ncbi:MAG: group III truncated hemoglobin [Saprospiraceae bacterium]
MKKDIDSQADIELLVRTFYDKALKDALLAPHFDGIDFEKHFPRMFDFWSFILLEKTGFTGNVFDKHRDLNIGQEEFDRWLFLFHETIDGFFEGPVADKAKSQSALLSYTFNQKMKFMGMGKYHSS